MVSFALSLEQAQNLRTMLNTVNVTGPQQAIFLVEVTMALEKGIMEAKTPPPPPPAPEVKPVEPLKE